MKERNILADLMLTFMKIGFFTFGGGYAMISIIENTCVEEKKWITHDEMMDITVIAESTPGPIAINCATYIGYKQAGFWGSVLTTLGVVLPSFIVIYIISMFLHHFLEIKIIASAFKGIKAAVGVLILNAAFNMMKKMKKNKQSKIFLAATIVVMLMVYLLSLNFSSIKLLVIAAVLSLAIFCLEDAAMKKKGSAQ